MHAKSLREALLLGASNSDLIWDYEHGYISFPKHEPDLPGHVFGAREFSRAHNYTHVLEDLDYFLPQAASVDSTLARAFNVRGTDSFHSILATVFEPEVIVAQLKDEATRHRFAAEQMAKVLNSTGINIDFSLSPEPTRYQDVQPEVCDEHAEWKAAMDD